MGVIVVVGSFPSNRGNCPRGNGSRVIVVLVGSNRRGS